MPTLGLIVVSGSRSFSLVFLLVSSAFGVPPRLSESMGDPGGVWWVMSLCLVKSRMQERYTKS